MAVLTKKEYEARRKETKKTRASSSSAPERKQPESGGETRPAPSGVIFILQDPEMRTFSDVVTIKGRPYTRVCQNGTLKTSYPELRDFHVSKGWLEFEPITKEAKNG